jgi:polyisoprenoid-binding protein YceI
MDGQPVPARIGLHGVTQEQQLTMTVTQSNADAITISGSFEILQTDFGIEPFSVFNGLLKVQDRLEISYQLVARKQ